MSEVRDGACLFKANENVERETKIEREREREREKERERAREREKFVDNR